MKTENANKNTTNDLVREQIFLRKFAEARGWARFRTPKNLSMALSVEVAELLELFQWDENSPSDSIRADKEMMDSICGEVADVFSYLIQFCDVLELDIIDCFWEKTKEIQKKYPLP